MIYSPLPEKNADISTSATTTITTTTTNVAPISSSHQQRRQQRVVVVAKSCSIPSSPPFNTTSTSSKTAILTRLLVVLALVALKLLLLPVAISTTTTAAHALPLANAAEKETTTTNTSSLSSKLLAANSATSPTTVDYSTSSSSHSPKNNSLNNEQSKLKFLSENSSSPSPSSTGTLLSTVAAVVGVVSSKISSSPGTAAAAAAANFSHQHRHQIEESDGGVSASPPSSSVVGVVQPLEENESYSSLLSSATGAGKGDDVAKEDSAVATPPLPKCLRTGDSYVRDHIQYECVEEHGPSVLQATPPPLVGPPSYSSSDGIGGGGEGAALPHRLFPKLLPLLPAPPFYLDAHPPRLAAQPIGCVVSSSKRGAVIQPGATHTNRHFRYECQRDANSGAISLRITHCVDNQGALVKLGDFFTQPSAANNAEHVSVECVGDEYRARKIVHKWSKCPLPPPSSDNGGSSTGGGHRRRPSIIEGNFVTEEVPIAELRSQLQSAEILSCNREAGEVSLRCTGCVTTTGVHVPITGYVNVNGQWTQCRKHRNSGCRLINVTSDYIDCQFDGRTIPNGQTFQSRSGLSSYSCSHGVIAKLGCIVDGHLLPVGDVRYLNGTQPVLCEQGSDKLTTFNGLVGCDLPDGRFKRFMEVWRDGKVMKRCSWLSNVDDVSGSAYGVISRSQVQPYACVDGPRGEHIPVGRIIQRPGSGEYVKCAPDNSAEGLAMRSLTLDELQEHMRRKTSQRNLVEYFGTGGRSRLEVESERRARQPPGKGESAHEHCSDMLPFCHRLAGYCSFTGAADGVESVGLVLENFADFREVQERFERLANTAVRDAVIPSAGCEQQLAPFQKFQSLVELACQKTCLKCTNVNQQERLLSSLEGTSHCG